ncbi:MAG: hypothetical protein WCQ70_11785 [Lentimicrobiaceae bacterium]
MNHPVLFIMFVIVVVAFAIFLGVVAKFMDDKKDKRFKERHISPKP